MLLLLSLPFAPLATAQEFSSLEERMSAADFRAAGLDKLSDAELARLNAWLRQHAPVVAAPARVGPAPRRGLLDRGERVVSRLAGDYRGQSGKGTRLTLENGQVWEITDSSARLTNQTLSHPKVIIEPGLIGGWYLRLDGYNARVTVRQIQ
jgi:hypothetical protein